MTSSFLEESQGALIIFVRGLSKFLFHRLDLRNRISSHDLQLAELVQKETLELLDVVVGGLGHSFIREYSAHYRILIGLDGCLAIYYNVELNKPVIRFLRVSIVVDCVVTLKTL